MARHSRISLLIPVLFVMAGCTDSGTLQNITSADAGDADAGALDAGGPDASETADGTPGCDPSLTYASFGMAFLDTYCGRCHGFTQQSAQLGGGAISGAAGTGQFMPPVDPRPSADQRQKLVAWIACGAL